MGGYLRDQGHGDMVWDHENYMSPVICKGEYDLMYHREWGWIMPVVEKISRIEFERRFDEDQGKWIIYTFHPVTFGMLDEQGRPMVRFYCNQLHFGDTLIEATWDAVVDFIKSNGHEQKAS